MNFALLMLSLIDILIWNPFLTSKAVRSSILIDNMEIIKYHPTVSHFSAPGENVCLLSLLYLYQPAKSEIHKCCLRHYLIYNIYEHHIASH